MIDITIEAGSVDIESHSRRTFGNSTPCIRLKLSNVDIQDLLEQLDEDDIMDFIGPAAAKDYFNLKDENE